MRICFINLHKNNFLLAPKEQIDSGWKVKTYKHKHLLDYMILQGYEIINYILCDETEQEVQETEARYVLEKNGFTQDDIQNVFFDKQIDNNDILIVYYYVFHSFKVANELKCKKILMGNHFIRTKTEQHYALAQLGYNMFVNETDVSNNGFVNEHFDMAGVNVVTFPYVYEDRFKITTDFGIRKKKAMAIGTLSRVLDIEEYQGYRDYFGTDIVQPMRKEILDSSKRIKKFIDSYISYVWDGRKSIKKTDRGIVRKYKEFYNRTHQQQKQYTSFDMVEKFNEYQMFICPEELAGVPGIGFVEGMACGTAYLGLDHEMYRCYGMIPGEHYISYDGTLGDLINKIKYYQSHEEELSKIAKNGMLFVRERFNREYVDNNFLSEIKKLAN